jgi:hypothetical protein
MSRRGRLVGCLGALALLSASGSAHARPVSLYDVHRDADVVLASGEVLVGRGTPAGGVRIDAFPLSGEAPRRLLALPAPASGWDGNVRLAASTERAAAAVSFDNEEDEPVEWRVYNGPPAGPLELLTGVRPQQPSDWFPVDVDVDVDRLLVSELRFDLRESRASVYAPGVPPEPVPLRGRFSAPDTLAGDYVAYVGSIRRSSGGRVGGVFVADRRSGGVRGRILLRRATDDVEYRDLDLTRSGRVVVAVDGRLLTAAPGQAQRRVPGTAGRNLDAPRLVGRRIVALATTRFGAQRVVVLDPRARTIRRIGPPSTAIEAVTAGGQSVAWLANGCVIAARLADGRFRSPPRGPCPRAEAFLDESDQLLHGRTVRVVVTCVAAPRPGCRGVAQLRGGSFGRGPVLGRGRFRVPAGRRRIVTVTLTPRGLRRVRRDLRREGDSVFGLDANVRNGRVSDSAGTSGALIDRVARRSLR